MQTPRMQKMKDFFSKKNQLVKKPFLIVLFFTTIFLFVLKVDKIFSASVAAPEVAGGEEVNPPGSYPWQVAIIESNATDNEFYLKRHCGGSLISEQWVLTAAHCLINLHTGVFPVSPSEIDIVAGIHTLGFPGGPTSGFQRRNIAVNGVIIHENFNCLPVQDSNGIFGCSTIEFENDIALLRLNTPVVPHNSGASSVGFVDIASSDLTNITGLDAVVIGWGLDGVGGLFDFPENNLHEATIPVRSECGNWPINYITDSMICAGSVDANNPAGSCNGDSGGPLVIFDTTWIQVGIVSFGNPDACGEPEWPGVYTKVSEYAYWIETQRAPWEPLATPELQYPPNGIQISVRPNFDWNFVLSAEHYVIQVSQFSDFSSNEITAVTENTFFIPDNDLVSNRTYYWRVWALRGEDSSPFSEVRTFITTASSPPPPTPPPPDNTPPSASGFTATANGSTADLSTSGVQDNSGGSGVREVRFSAKFNNQWVGIGTDTTSPYSLAWNMCASGVPDGDVELGMEVWDNANNVWIWSQHYTNPHITKSYNCEPPPPSEGVTLFENTGLGGGSCYITQDVPSIGNYCGSGWNDNAESVLVQGPFYFALYFDDWYGGGTPYTGNPTGDLPPDWRNQASSIRIRRNNPAAFTLFDLGDFNGEAWASDRTIYDLSHWNWNDKAESIQVASGYGLIVCEHADFKGICGRATGPAEWSDINALAQGLRNNVSSIRVCSGPCPEAGEPPTLIFPINNQAIEAGESAILSWSGAVDQFYVEVWGGALGSTLQYGWTNNVQWDLGVLPESPNQYYWHVKGWMGYGETDWSSGSFYVMLPDTTSPSGAITGPQSGGYQGGPTVTISADASDVGSGVNRLEFYAWLDDHWEFLGTDNNSPYSFSWNISSVREGGVWVSADVIDNAGNHSGLIWEPDWAFFVIDKTPPISAVIPLPSIQMYPQFTVRWSGNDNFTQNDLIFYDVQYQLNCSGEWLDWFVMDNWEGATFNGEVGKTYCFRSRAYDLVGNTEAWPDFADAQTTVNSITKVFLPLVLNGASSPNPTSTPTPSPTLTPTPIPTVTPTPLPGSDWTFIGSGEPEARSGHGMALDTSNNQLVIFGGTCDGFACADTWTFGESGWMAIGGLGPSAREDSFMVYDEDRQKIVLFGGHAWAANVLGDTWEFNGDSWTSMNFQHNPPARANQAMAYDPVRKRVVMFGGWQGGTEYLWDTWEYDGINWYQIYPAHSPTPRRGARMVYVPALNKIVMFGGLSPTLDVFDETWVYDGQDWTQLNTGLAPNARYNHQMVYDPIKNAIILFGGYRIDTGAFADTWAFNNTSWELVIPTNSPPPTWLAGFAYYPPLSGVLMFGGNSPNQGNLNNDLWLYSLTP